MANHPFEAEHIDLIRGIFEPDNAEEILLTLINDKIRFHQRSNWGKRERMGSSDPGELKRVTELKQARSDIQAILTRAREKGYRLKLTSVINIKLEGDLPE